MIVLTTLALADPGPRYDAFVEVGGSGGVGSLNFSFEPSNRAPWLRLRFGIFTMPIDRNTGWVIVAPAMVEVESKGVFSVVGGLGIGPSTTTKLHPHLRGVLEGGVRIRPGERFWFGLAYTPLVSVLLDRQWQHWAGAQFGVSL